MGIGALCDLPLDDKWFPNLHADSILVPFFLLAVYLLLKRRYAGAGAAYGLALASKNVAILLLPALIMNAAMEVFAANRQSGRAAALATSRQQAKNLAAMMAVAFIVFLPFANPVTYAEEILTPVISRPIDPRGEYMGGWQLKNWVAKNAGSGQADRVADSDHRSARNWCWPSGSYTSMI